MTANIEQGFADKIYRLLNRMHLTACTGCTRQLNRMPLTAYAVYVSGLVLLGSGCQVLLG